MRNFLLGLVVGALSMLIVVALGWIQVTSARTAELNTPSTTVGINTNQIHRDTKSLVNGRSSSIDEKIVTGRITGLDGAKQQVFIQSSDQTPVTLHILSYTKIRILERDGTFNDLQVSQPVTCSYMVAEGNNNCLSLSVEK